MSKQTSVRGYGCASSLSLAIFLCLAGNAAGQGVSGVAAHVVGGFIEIQPAPQGAPTGAHVWVVSPGGTGHFTQIQPAVDSASDGDTVLVKTGTYAPVVIQNKRLAIVGDSGASVSIVGGIRVLDLALEKTVVLANLTSTGIPSLTGTGQNGLLLANDAGHVRVESCTLTGASVPPCGMPSFPHPSTNAWDGVRATSTADLAFVRCTIRGGNSDGNGDGPEGLAGDGGDFVACSLTMYEHLALGGHGLVPSCCDGGNGAMGMRLQGSALFASKSQARGGDGAASTDCPPCAYGGDGGSGASLFTSSTLHALQVTASGGTGGPGYPNLGCSPDEVNGYAGSAYVVSSDSSRILIPGSGRSMIAPTPVRANAWVTFSFSGAPGEQVRLLLSLAADREYVPEQKGVLLLRQPLRFFSLGTISADGTLTVQVKILSLPPPDETRVLHAQAQFLNGLQGVALGSPSCLVVLDPSF